MSSLSEMLAAADFIGRNKAEASVGGQLSSLVNSAATGYLTGREMARKQKEQELDRTVKLLDAKSKMEQMKTDAQNRKIAGNMAKRLGLLDLNEGEADVARSVAFDSIGSPEPTPDHTAAGKISKMYQTGVEPQSGITWKFSEKGGFSFEPKEEKTPTPKDPSANMERIRNAAIEAAKREKTSLVSSLIPPEEVQKLPSYLFEPTEDEVQKYMPEYEAYFGGDTKKAKSLRESRALDTAPVGEQLKGLQEEITTLRQKGNDFNPFTSGNPERVSTLTARRDELLRGGGKPAILKQISEDLADLLQNPAKNREAIKALTRKKIQLMTAGGK